MIVVLKDDVIMHHCTSLIVVLKDDVIMHHCLYMVLKDDVVSIIVVYQCDIINSSIVVLNCIMYIIHIYC